MAGKPPREVVLAAKAEKERRRREMMATLGPKYDWFGPSCSTWGCPRYEADTGRCPEHPRAREKQKPPPGDWLTYLISAGRSGGKTRAAAEIIRYQVEWHDARGETIRVALVNETVRDVRLVQVEGESGLLAVSPPWFKPYYKPSTAEVIWPNGSVAYIYSAEEPGQLRGPQHHYAWCLAGRSPVLMADGSERGISEVRVGDLVATRLGPKPVIASCMTRRDAVVHRVMMATGREIVGTHDHEVFVIDSCQFEPIGSIRVGSTLWDADLGLGSNDRVVSIVRLDSTEDVYDIAVEDASEFFVSRLLVHNCDELAKWKKAQQATWDNLILGLRLGKHPQVIVTTTPQPTPTFKQILRDPQTVVRTWSTYDNLANVAPSFRQTILSKYEGTRLGRQELHAEVLEDNPSALWRTGMLDELRVGVVPQGVSLKRIVVGVDPAGKVGDMTKFAHGMPTGGGDGKGDDAGIIVGGLGSDDHLYILADYTTSGSPDAWGRAVKAAYDRYKADRVVWESNHGGEVVASVLTTVDRNMSHKKVFASRGKAERLDNPILTVDGWKTFGTLVDGDHVFDHMGRPTEITMLPVHSANCARVTFSDGTSGVYAMEHEWRVLQKESIRSFIRNVSHDADWSRWESAGKGNYPSRAMNDAARARAKQLRSLGWSYSQIARDVGVTIGSVSTVLRRADTANATKVRFVEKTTSELMEEMSSGAEYLIAAGRPLQIEHSSYIDPYLLGLWIGDGFVGASALASKTPDDTERIVEELRRRGFKVVHRGSVLYIRDMRWAFADRKKKRIYTDEWMVRPDERIDLIRGLIDSDGTRPSHSSIKISQSGYRIKSVLEPATDAMRSLGWVVGPIREKPTDRLPAGTIKVIPNVIDCAGLPRKCLRNTQHYSKYREIVSIKPVGEHLVRCIEVDSPDHLYLSGRGLIPTHNSVRAEPVAALYEQGKVHHVGEFGELEREMMEWTPGDPSPNRLDALVWVATELMLDGEVEKIEYPYARMSVRGLF